MNYYIAYKNTDGKDFFGDPWILDDSDTWQDAVISGTKMVQDGYQDVYVFGVPDDEELPEIFSWKFVKEHGEYVK